MIPMLTDEEIRWKLSSLKGVRYLKFKGDGICWRAIGDVLGIKQQAFYKYASGNNRFKEGIPDSFREKISEFLYRYERGEITLTRASGKWEVVFNKEPKRRDRLESRVEITMEGVVLKWVRNDN